MFVDGQAYYLIGDDAMISMRYAYNLAHGRGLVWNAGEYVQGYTNPGWTLVMAAVHGAGVPLRIAPLVMQLINVAVFAALVWLLVTRLRPLPGLIAGLLVAFDGSVMVW